MVRFMAYAMRYATAEDMAVRLAHVGKEGLREAIDRAPPGIIDERWWAYWNGQIGRYPAPPAPRRALQLPGQRCRLERHFFCARQPPRRTVCHAFRMTSAFPTYAASVFCPATQMAVEEMLGKVADDLAELRVGKGAMWRLTARRMLLDYGNIERQALIIALQVEQWEADSDLSKDQVLKLKATVRELTRLVRQVQQAAERGILEGDGLGVFADGDSEGYEVVLGLIDQELSGDEAIKGFLREVLADKMPFLHDPAEFVKLQVFYAPQLAMVAELCCQERRLRKVGASARSKRAISKLAKLRRNVPSIEKMLTRVLAMYD